MTSHERQESLRLSTKGGLGCEFQISAFFEAKMISVYTYDLWCVEVLLLNAYNSLTGWEYTKFHRRNRGENG